MSKKFLIGVLIVLLIVGGWLLLRPKGNTGLIDVTLTTNPNPLRLGTATFTIQVKDGGRKSINNATVFFDLNMAMMNMGQQSGNATPIGGGQYSATGRLTMQGQWKVKTLITLPDGSQNNKTFTVNVP